MDRRMDLFQKNDSTEDKEFLRKMAIKQLSGADFTGIGQKAATKIVNVLGTDAINRIANNLNLVDQVSLGLSEKQRDNLREAFKQRIIPQRLRGGYAHLGFSESDLEAINDTYGENAEKILAQNIYRVVSDVDGIGFVKADRVAHQSGYDFLDYRRLQAALVYKLKDIASRDGSTYTEIGYLLSRTVYQLKNKSWYTPLKDDVINQKLRQELTNLQDKKVIKGIKANINGVRQNKYVMLKHLYEAEYTIAERLYKLTHNLNDSLLSSLEEQLNSTGLSQEEYLTEIIDRVEDSLGINYDDNQREAIIQALSNKVFILVGGPGTGKTTIIKGILAAYSYILPEIDNPDNFVEELNDLAIKYEESQNPKEDDNDNFSDDSDYRSRPKPSPVSLVAPTGKASQRMKDSTGIQASTIHRALGMTVGSNQHTKDFESKLIIVDEASMLDTSLAATLLSAIPNDARLIIVGDSDQLPSVQPGKVLNDILDSKLITSKRLTRIYRQGEGSEIVDLAQAINHGSFPTDLTKESATVKFIEAEGGISAQHTILHVVDELRSKGISFDDFQILAPMKKTSAGVNELNTQIRSKFNPKAKETIKTIDAGWGKVFSVGDKVINSANMPDQQIFNGDVGKIIRVQHYEETNDGKPAIPNRISVRFERPDGSITTVNFDDEKMQRLDLAYAMTIHKSQGSEYPIVIIPMTSEFSYMFSRNILYTAVTRAKKCIYLVGERKAFENCAEDLRPIKKRVTFLVRRMEWYFSKKG